MGPRTHRRTRFRPPESTTVNRSSTGVTPLLWWTRPRLIDSVGVLALFLPRGPNRGTRRLERHDAYGTQPGRAQARRADARSRIAAALAGNRRPTTPDRPATGRYPDQSGPARSDRSPLRVPDASVRLARALWTRRGFVRVSARASIRRPAPSSNVGQRNRALAVVRIELSCSTDTPPSRPARV